MDVRIEAREGYLHVVIRRRETAEETIAGWERMLDAAAEHRLSRFLILLRESRAIFTVERYGLSSVMERIAALQPPPRIATVPDSEELFASHEYVELLSRQRGIAMRVFRTEAAAIEWLQAP